MALPTNTFSSKDRPLFQPYGTGGSAISTFQTASISSLTVSSINGLVPEDLNPADWSLYPAINALDMSTFSINNVPAINGEANINIQAGTSNDSAGLFGSNVLLTTTNSAGGSILFRDSSYIPYGGINSNTGLTIKTVNTSTVNASTINASTITVNTLVALSTVTAISTLSTTVLEAPEIINLSSINGLSLSSFVGNSGDWSYFPALSTIDAAGNNLANLATLYSYPNQPLYINGSTGTFFRNGLDQAQLDLSGQNARFFNDVRIDGNLSTFGSISASTITTSDISANSISVSSINGIEFTGGGGGSITVSTLASEAFSTIGASIQQGLMSSIVFNPQVSPTFNVDLGLGNFGIGLGTGLFAVAVGVPTLAGTLTYGLVKGIASAFEPKPVNNITNSNFEVFNYQSQLQISTLGNYISTCYTFLSTIPSTVVINDSNINSTVSFIDYPFVFSTVSQSSNPTCIRAIADPLQTISTPWTYSQALNDYSWVELPSSIGGGGISSNVSTLSLSTLTLLPSTLMRGINGPGGVLEILEPDGTNYGQTLAQGYNVAFDTADTVNAIYTKGISGTNSYPAYLDNNFSTFRIALQAQDVSFNSVNLPTFDVNKSTITNLGMSNVGEPTLTYGLYPPGFPSTIAGQINFKSSLTGGYGGVQLLSQFGSNARLDVGQYVYATDMLVGDSNGLPFVVQVPQLDGFPLLSMSTIGAGIASSEVIGLTSTNTGQLVIAAPNLSTGLTTRMMTLDTLTSTVSVSKNLQAPNVVAGGPTGNAYTAVLPDLDQWGVLKISTLAGDDRVATILDTLNDGTVYMNSMPSVSGGNISTSLYLNGLTSAVGIMNSAPGAYLDVGGLNYSSPNSVGIFGKDVNGTLEVTLQNKSTGSNASAFYFAVENTGNEYAGFGVNSMNLSSLNNTLFEIPGASIQSGTLDCVIGPQSDHSSNSGTYLTYQDGASAWHINSNGALSFNATYSNNVLNEGNFGVNGAVLQTNGSGSTPSWVNSIALNTASASTMNANQFNLTTPSFVAPTPLINTTNGGALVEIFDNLASPAGYVTTISNLDTTAGLRGKANINLIGSISSVGVHKIPEAGYALDVEGTIKATSSIYTRQAQVSTINTQVISTFGAGQALLLNSAADIDLTPASGTAVNINDGAGPAGNQNGLLRFGETNVTHTGYIGPETFIANNYYPGSYSGGWTNYTNKAIRVEYSVTSDSSFGGGLGKAEVTLPVGLSTVACVQGTYVAFQDASPGLTHPIWLYSTINDGNGLISTVQVGGGQNTDMYVSVLGYV